MEVAIDINNLNVLDAVLQLDQDPVHAEAQIAVLDCISLMKKSLQDDLQAKSAMYSDSNSEFKTVISRSKGAQKSRISNARTRAKHSFELSCRFLMA